MIVERVTYDDTMRTQRFWLESFAITDPEDRRVLAELDDMESMWLWPSVHDGRLEWIGGAGDTLRIVLTLDDDDALARYQQVIENHLQRFARDETLAFDWRPA